MKQTNLIKDTEHESLTLPSPCGEGPGERYLFKDGLNIREIAGERIAIRQGVSGVDLTQVISFNATAEWLYSQLSGKEFEEADVVRLLVDHFSIDETTALTDTRKWIQQSLDAGIIQ
jgi:hypothetical protein